jgi:hypothetical protein
MIDCKSWSPGLKQGQVFDNRIVKRTFGPEREDENEEFRKITQ